MALLTLLLCIPNTFFETCCFSNLFSITGGRVVALLTLLLCIPNTFFEKCCFSNLFLNMLFSNLFPVAGTLVVALLTLLLCIQNTFLKTVVFQSYVQSMFLTVWTLIHVCDLCWVSHSFRLKRSSVLVRTCLPGRLCRPSFLFR